MPWCLARVFALFGGRCPGLKQEELSAAFHSFLSLLLEAIMIIISFFFQFLNPTSERIQVVCRLVVINRRISLTRVRTK